MIVYSPGNTLPLMHSSTPSRLRHAPTLLVVHQVPCDSHVQRVLVEGVQHLEQHVALPRLQLHLLRLLRQRLLLPLGNAHALLRISFDCVGSPSGRRTSRSTVAATPRRTRPREADCPPPRRSRPAAAARRRSAAPCCPEWSGSAASASRCSGLCLTLTAMPHCPAGRWSSCATTAAALATHWGRCPAPSGRECVARTACPPKRACVAARRRGREKARVCRANLFQLCPLWNCSLYSLSLHC